MDETMRFIKESRRMERMMARMRAKCEKERAEVFIDVIYI